MVLASGEAGQQVVLVRVPKGGDLLTFYERLTM